MVYITRRIASLGLVSEFLRDFLSATVVGHFIKSHFSVRKLTSRLQRLYDLIYALVSRYAATAHGLSIARVSIFRYVPIYRYKTGLQLNSFHALLEQHLF